MSNTHDRHMTRPATSPGRPSLTAPRAVETDAIPAEGASAHLCEDAIGGVRALSLAQQAIAQGELDDAVVLAFDDLSSPLSLAEIASQAVLPSAYSVAVVHLSCEDRAATHQLKKI